MEEAMSHTPIPIFQCQIASKCKIQAMPCCQKQSQAAIGEFKIENFTKYLQLWHNNWDHYTKARRNYTVKTAWKKLLNFL